MTLPTLKLIEAARLLRLDPAQGWPATLTPGQLAALQTWREGMDNKTWRSKASTWQKLIELALTAGAIEHTTTTERVTAYDPFSAYDAPPQGRRMLSSGIASHEWESRDGFSTYARTPPPQTKDVTRQHIAAPAFAAWLARQGEEPSPHIAAWFKAVGVAPATAAKPPAPAPTAPPAVETTAQRNDRWLAMFDEEKRTGPEVGAQTRAIDRIAAAEGVTKDTAKKAIQKAAKARAESYRAGGVTPIKSGKNTVSSVFDLAKPRGRTAR